MDISSGSVLRLRNHRLFHGVDDDVFFYLQKHAKMMTLSAGKTIIMPGDRPLYLYLIGDGWVKIYHLNEEGHETVFGLLGPHDLLFGDLMFLVEESSVGAVAESSLELVALPVDVMLAMILKTPKLATNLMAIVADQMQHVVRLLEQVVAEPAMAKVLNTLLRLMLDGDNIPKKEFDLPLAKTEIAHCLGLSRETFSRCLARMEEYNIKIDGRRVVLEHDRALCPFCDPLMATHCHRFGEKNFCRRSVDFQKP